MDDIQFDEDKVWKRTDEARSLKDSGIECIVKSDNTHLVECLDYNYTHRKLKMSINPISIIDKKNITIKIMTKEYNEISGKEEFIEKSREIKGIKNVFVRSGIRYDLASDEYIKEIAKHHIYKMLRIAPEHVNKEVLRLMNKDMGDINKFLAKFKKANPLKDVAFYFMTAHPGSGMKEAEELAKTMNNLKNTETVQVFTPTPMTVSTCMYYTSMEPKTKKKIYVPYSYSEKKEQKRILPVSETSF